MTREVLSNAQFGEVLQTFRHTAFRLELQRAYIEPDERGLLGAYLRGEPRVPTSVPGFARWYERVAGHVGQGRRMDRVRVQDEPPTHYQRFERWLDQWNEPAGEVIRYMTRKRAYEVGLLPDAGDTDWWLLDSSRLLVMRFDAAGHRVENEMVTDPPAVVQACAWRDLAVHHSVRMHTSDV